MSRTNLFAFCVVFSTAAVGCNRDGSLDLGGNDPAPAAPAAQPASETAAESQSDVPITKRTTREVLDLAALSADEGWEVGETGVSGSDPLSVAQSSYVHAASTVGPIPLQQWIKQHQALNGNYPTHAELVAWLDQNPGVKLPALKPWQHYAYDADAGQVVVVENATQRREMLNAAGVETGG